MRPLVKDLMLEIALFLASTIIIITLWRDNAIVFVLLIALLVIALKFWHKKNDIIFFVVAAIIGPVSEIIAIHFGVWAYANPSLLGIPEWLPLAWGYVGMLIRRFALTISKWRGWK